MTMTEPGMCCVAHSVKLGIITVPKVASTSIKLALMRTDGIRGEFSVPEIHATVPSMTLRAARNRGYLIAVFVRHPYLRLASVWRDRLHGRVLGETRLTLRRVGFDPNMTFDEFVRRIEEISPRVEKHVFRQTAFLDRVLPRFVGKFENLKADWKALSRRRPGLAPLPFENRTDGDRPSMSLETKAIIRRVYADDFYRFGYH